MRIGTLGLTTLAVLAFLQAAHGQLIYTTHAIGQNLGMIEIDAGDGCIAPDDATIASGEYAFSRPLFIYVRKDALENNENGEIVLEGGQPVKATDENGEFITTDYEIPGHYQYRSNLNPNHKDGDHWSITEVFMCHLISHGSEANGCGEILMGEIGCRWMGSW